MTCSTLLLTLRIKLIIFATVKVNYMCINVLIVDINTVMVFYLIFTASVEGIMELVGSFALSTYIKYISYQVSLHSALNPFISFCLNENHVLQVFSHKCNLPFHCPSQSSKRQKCLAWLNVFMFVFPGKTAWLKWQIINKSFKY